MPPVDLHDFALDDPAPLFSQAIRSDQGPSQLDKIAGLLFDKSQQGCVAAKLRDRRYGGFREKARHLVTDQQVGLRPGQGGRPRRRRGAPRRIVIPDIRRQRICASHAGLVGVAPILPRLESV
jgi:hypothetical protein